MSSRALSRQVSTMSSRAASAAAGGEQHRRQHVTAACGGPIIRPVPGAAGPPPRPGTPRPGGPSPSGRAGPEYKYNWWGAGARQQATPRRPRSSRGACARVPTGKGNRELVRRALAPPAARGRGRSGALLLMRRWSFRPAPSRLRDASSLSSHPLSPASPRPRPSS